MAAECKRIDCVNQSNNKNANKSDETIVGLKSTRLLFVTISFELKISEK